MHALLVLARCPSSGTRVVACANTILVPGHPSSRPVGSFNAAGIVRALPVLLITPLRQTPRTRLLTYVTIYSLLAASLFALHFNLIVQLTSFWSPRSHRHGCSAIGNRRDDLPPCSKRGPPRPAFPAIHGSSLFLHYLRYPPILQILHRHTGWTLAAP